MILSIVFMGYLAPIAEHSATLPRGLAAFLLILAAALLPFMLLGTLLTRTIKRHIAYPRTGYVAYRRFPAANRGRALIFAVALSAAAALLAALVPLIQRNQDAGIIRALMISGFLAPYAFFTVNAGRERPWKWYAVLAVAAGLLVLVFLIPGGAQQLSRPVMLFSAARWLVSGASTLLGYIRRTQAPAAGDE